MRRRDSMRAPPTHRRATACDVVTPRARTRGRRPAAGLVQRRRPRARVFLPLAAHAPASAALRPTHTPLPLTARGSPSEWPRVYPLGCDRAAAAAPGPSRAAPRQSHGMGSLSRGWAARGAARKLPGGTTEAVAAARRSGRVACGGEACGGGSAGARRREGRRFEERRRSHRGRGHPRRRSR